jgi:uncharacterized BrkB/YihY/UPF0761 family membrane protein
MSSLRFDSIGPGAFLREFKDEWLVTRQAAKLFFLSAILLLSITPVFLGWIDTSKMTFWMRLPWGILGVRGTIALFFLWLGMWRYWLRIDDSRAWVKRIWFLILLIGFCWGSFLYFFSVYLPQAIRRGRGVEA